MTSVTLRCPHRREMTVFLAMGLAVYLHADDDTPCPLMNVFSTSAETILKEMVLAHQPEIEQGIMTDALATALKTSTKARKGYYGTLIPLGDADLEQALHRLDNAIGIAAHAEELIETFGQPAYDNILHLFGSDALTHVSKQSLQTLLASKKRFWFMDNLKVKAENRRIGGAVGNIEGFFSGEFAARSADIKSALHKIKER